MEMEMDREREGERERDEMRRENYRWEIYYPDLFCQYVLQLRDVVMIYNVPVTCHRTPHDR
jgi:hypothetical protein